MLTLHHHGSSVCAAKVRFALAEKGVAWEGVYIDILKGDQFTPEFRKLNPKALVPVLVHDGHVLTESTVIAEYIDEAFDGPALKPATALGRHAMRLWTKIVDEQLHLSVGALTFAGCHRFIINRMPPAEKEAFLAATPEDSVRWGWPKEKRDLVEMGFAAPQAPAHVKLYDKCLAEAEKALANGPWLAGEQFSLADIGMAPYVNRVAMLGWSFMWEEKRPHLTDWWRRITARPSFKPTFLDWCPPELTRDLITFGTQSMPEVRRLLS